MRTVGSQQLLSRFARGAYGDLFIGRSDSGAPTAVKLFAPDLAQNERFRRAIIDGARVVDVLVPGVVPVVEIGIDGVDLFVTRPFISAVALHELTARGGRRLIDGRLMLHVAAELAAVLYELLREGGELDALTPERVLIDFHGGVSLLGLGEARAKSLVPARGREGLYLFDPRDSVQGRLVYGLGRWMVEAMSAHRLEEIERAGTPVGRWIDGYDADLRDLVSSMVSTTATERPSLDTVDTFLRALLGRERDELRVELAEAIELRKPDARATRERLVSRALAWQARASRPPKPGPGGGLQAVPLPQPSISSLETDVVHAYSPSSDDEAPETGTTSPTRGQTSVDERSPLSKTLTVSVEDRTRLGRYEILRLLDWPWHSAVSTATAFDPLTQRRVIVAWADALSPMAAADLRRMARVWSAAMRVPGVPIVLDAGEEEAGTFYIVIELVEGDVLANLESSTELSSASVAQLARHLCDGLGALAEQGIAHGAVDARHVVRGPRRFWILPSWVASAPGEREVMEPVPSKSRDQMALISLIDAFSSAREDGADEPTDLQPTAEERSYEALANLLAERLARVSLRRMEEAK